MHGHIVLVNIKANQFHQEGSIHTISDPTIEISQIWYTQEYLLGPFVVRNQVMEVVRVWRTIYKLLTLVTIQI